MSHLHILPNGVVHHELANNTRTCSLNFGSCHGIVEGPAAQTSRPKLSARYAHLKFARLSRTLMRVASRY